MKIAIIGSTSFDTLEYNLNEAFNFNGHTCKVFDLYDHALFKNKYLHKLDYIGRRFSDSYDQQVFCRLAKKVDAFDPELIIGIYRFIHPDFVVWIKKDYRRVIHINPDQMTTLENQQIFASNYDVWFTKDPYMLSFMKKQMHLNAKIYYEAFNKRIHVKPETDKLEYEDKINIDVMTYGSMYPYRNRMLRLLAESGIKISLYGRKPHRFYDNSLDNMYQNQYITGETKTKLLYGARIVFNNMHYAEIESVNNRFFETNGSGAFQLSDFRPILQDLLPVDPELVSFKSIDEGIDKVKYYLNHPQERIDISSKIYKHFMLHYTYDNLIKYILSNID